MMNTAEKVHRKTRDRKRSILGLLARAAGLRHQDRPERGSALLATLMVITGLTLLGLGFVAITQTESAISMNEKNYTQTLQIAEAGALRCVDWFQNPVWARDQRILPNNNDAIKVERRVFIGMTGQYIGRYKDASGDILFDKPFRSTIGRHRFFGTEDNPDIWINPTTSAAAGPVPSITPTQDFLTRFNVALFNTNTAIGEMDNAEGGVVTDIRIYAPPVEGANINTEAGWTGATGFIEGGTRFGVATIRVTATKFNPACRTFPCTGRVIATRTVKVTVTEWPFPGPQGPVQTNANLATSGNIQIHWGRTTASGDMQMAKTFVAIPWAHAYDMAHYEHGYDNLVWPTGFTSHTWPRTATASGVEAYNYLYELMGRRFEDPWWEMRARGSLNVGSTLPIPYPYSYGANPAINRSNWFQYQNQASYNTKKNVLFPRMDYTFWKQVAQSADDEGNIYYLSWVSGDEFRDKAGNQRSFREWIDVTSLPPAGTGAKSVPGYYFFDTQNGMNPQNNGAGVLTPDINVKGGSMEAKGFWYANAASFGSQGVNGNDEWVNMPGEPYRDIGFFWVEKVDATSPDYKSWARADTAGPACAPGTLVGMANCKLHGAANGAWDYEDLPWSNGGSTENGVFDVFVAQEPATTTRSGGVVIPASDRWKPVPWTPGCNPGTNGGAGSPNCSEPHEPYLNLVYPTIPLGGPIADWYDPSALSATLAGTGGVQTRRPKKLDAAGSPLSCVAENTALATLETDRENCTSNGWDKDGGLVQLEIVFNGVLYNEGDFDSTGSAVYFGSVLAQGDAAKAGQPDVYFDEKLVKDAWPPGNFGFPRVYISSQQTDQ